jgi:hypothetical protein
MEQYGERWCSRRGRGDGLFRTRFDAIAEDDPVAKLTPQAATRQVEVRHFFNSVGQLTTTVIDVAALSPAGGKARMRRPSGATS